MSAVIPEPMAAPPSRASRATLPDETGPGPGKLYASHFGFVWRNLRRLGVPDAQLEDAAQDVFLTVHRRWDSYDAQRSSVETWLFGILLRVAKNHRRSLRRRLARLVPWSERHSLRATWPSADGPTELIAKRQAAALLDRLLDNLDQDKRAILVLVELEQLSVARAAEILGLNLNTAYWRLGAARRMFQGAIERVRVAERRRTGGNSP